MCLWTCKPCLRYSGDRGRNTGVLRVTGVNEAIRYECRLVRFDILQEWDEGSTLRAVDFHLESAWTTTLRAT